MLPPFPARAKSFLTLLALGALAVASVGCAGGGNDDDGPVPTGSGSLAVRLAEGPAPGIHQTWITIGRVEAQLDGKWQTLSTTPQTFGTSDHGQSDKSNRLLAEGTVPAGRYRQIRLFIDSVRVNDNDGIHDVTLPSGSADGIERDLSYRVTPGAVTELLVDFNLPRLVVKEGTGSYRLEPQIPVVVKAEVGTVSGTAVDPNGFALLSEAGITATYTAGPAYRPGTVVSTGATRWNGTYRLWALPPGTYTLSFHGNAIYTSTIHRVTVPNVVVTAGTDTVLPNIAAAPHRDACVAILKEIAWAKDQTALKYGMAEGYPCEFHHLTGPAGFLKGPTAGPICPAGGFYDVNHIGTPPTCSYPDHVLP